MLHNITRFTASLAGAALFALIGVQGNLVPTASSVSADQIQVRALPFHDQPCDIDVEGGMVKALDSTSKQPLPPTDTCTTQGQTVSDSSPFG